MLKCDSYSKIKELKHGPVNVVAEQQDERQMRKEGTCIPPHPVPCSILMCYRAHPSSYPVGNEALFRLKSGQGMKLTTDVHVVQSPKVMSSHILLVHTYSWRCYIISTAKHLPLSFIFSTAASQVQKYQSEGSGRSYFASLLDSV